MNPFSVINSSIDKASSEGFRLSSGPSAKFISDITKDNPFDLLEDKFTKFTDQAMAAL
ncbi:MAG: hypothetical protein LBP22_04545 [Deltaproteobacteria bacterium]|nr:hypothetical protein [Deltaproteobacteria bacterium]